uniref:Uncharacterized protein n=1 Tax=Anopheles atroparvus TaxID=41427 RepID=A0A182JIH1_ANOAO
MNGIQSVQTNYYSSGAKCSGKVGGGRMWPRLDSICGARARESKGRPKKANARVPFEREIDRKLNGKALVAAAAATAAAVGCLSCAVLAANWDPAPARIQLRPVSITAGPSGSKQSRLKVGLPVAVSRQQGRGGRRARALLDNHERVTIGGVSCKILNMEIAGSRPSDTPIRRTTVFPPPSERMAEKPLCVCVWLV